MFTLDTERVELSNFNAILMINKKFSKLQTCFLIKIAINTTTIEAGHINVRCGPRTLPRSQSYQTLISLFFWFLLLSLAISKYRQYFLILQTLKLNNKKRKKSSFYEEKSLVGLTQGLIYIYLSKKTNSASSGHSYLNRFRLLPNH